MADDRDKNYMKKIAKARVAKNAKPQAGDPGYKTPYRTSTYTSSGGSGAGSTYPRNYTPAASNSSSAGWQGQGKNARHSGSFKYYDKVRKARGQ